MTLQDKPIFILYIFYIKFTFGNHNLKRTDEIAMNILNLKKKHVQEKLIFAGSFSNYARHIHGEVYGFKLSDPHFTQISGATHICLWKAVLEQKYSVMEGGHFERCIRELLTCATQFNTKHQHGYADNVAFRIMLQFNVAITTLS
jgi:hypothetical protein